MNTAQPQTTFGQARDVAARLERAGFPMSIVTVWPLLQSALVSQSRGEKFLVWWAGKEDNVMMVLRMIWDLAPWPPEAQEAAQHDAAFRRRLVAAARAVRGNELSRTNATAQDWQSLCSERNGIAGQNLSQETRFATFAEVLAWGGEEPNNELQKRRKAAFEDMLMALRFASVALKYRLTNRPHPDSEEIMQRITAAIEAGEEINPIWRECRSYADLQWLARLINQRVPILPGNPSMLFRVTLNCAEIARIRSLIEA